MKKVTPKGALIKELREQLERGALQKEMAHAVRVSERQLRAIENENAPVSMEVLGRIATYLGVTREQIAYAIDTPKLVPPVVPAIEKIVDEFGRDRIVPRFETELAHATMDEGRLLHDAQHSHDLKAQIDVALNEETSGYAEELTRLLTELTWSKRDWTVELTPADEIALRRRLRQLLVLLKGNDVWVYYTRHMRRLPERFTVAPPEEPHEIKDRLVIAFGPPGEYGEVSMLVDVDNGQPWFLKGWNSKKQGAE